MCISLFKLFSVSLFKKLLNILLNIKVKATHKNVIFLLILENILKSSEYIFLILMRSESSNQSV